MIERFARIKLLDVPPIDFYQLKVSYQTLTTEEHPHTDEKLADEKIFTEADVTLIHRQDLSGNILGHYMVETEEGEYISFRRWLYLIAKESFRTLTPENLKRHEEALRKIFERITVKDESGNTRYDSRYDQTDIRSLIRKAFVPKRDFTVREEIVPCEAKLLHIEDHVSPFPLEKGKPFYPSQEDVQVIMDWDNDTQKKVLSPEELALMEKIKQKGFTVPELSDPHPERKQTYHYLPYRFDRGLEREFFKDSILPYLKGKPLEIYFNGDSSLTEFNINCYKQVGKEWRYIGKYTPDFLLLSRKDDGKIHRIIIIETKGEGFAAKFADRKKFMETEFIQKNNERFGYERFHFLYLEDTQSKEEREKLTIKTIKEFFKI